MAADSVPLFVMDAGASKLPVVTVPTAMVALVPPPPEMLPPTVSWLTWVRVASAMPLPQELVLGP
jgi:hypothetical protein